MSTDTSNTMQYLKKYFTEGLIQMAIILSLCGMMVDVGLEPYLPASWHERILGPTSALTQTQFHNLRNRLEDGPELHPKNVDLDSFFTARRLLGLVHSLDRLQVGKSAHFHFCKVSANFIYLSSKLSGLCSIGSTSGAGDMVGPARARSSSCWITGSGLTTGQRTSRH